MRYVEERTTAGAALAPALPYSGVRYGALAASLERVLPPGVVRRGRRVAAVADGAVTFEDGSSRACDAVVGADGPRSLARRFVDDADDGSLRFAGYSALRGTATPPPDVLAAIRGEFSEFGNCNCFLLADGAHAVLYDVGDDRRRDGAEGTRHHASRRRRHDQLARLRERRPAASGRDDAPATAEEVAGLKRGATARWGAGLGALVELTEAPFWTDIYDLERPLEDAFVLASCAAGADDARGWLAAYSAARAEEAGPRCSTRGTSAACATADGGPPPADEASFAARVKAAGLPTRMLPAHAAFAPVASLRTRCPRTSGASAW
ncbi:FAD-binding domain-containing protein [Aureococcus anophagefferens]|nr:FAD-binding domain-containing protein [Aureococcus anophagefferens]